MALSINSAEVQTMSASRVSSVFTSFSKRVSRAAGRPATFIIAVAVVIGWALTGPLFGFSDTWQLVINTSTTIITFLMVFLIQNTQNRDSEAMQVKLDELIRVTVGAHNALLDLEELEEADLDRIRAQYRLLAQIAREEMRRGGADTDAPDVDQQSTDRRDKKETHL
jgi:low affinity Fe/Cu permease